jgi:hypothetical protein
VLGVRQPRIQSSPDHSDHTCNARGGPLWEDARA